MELPPGFHHYQFRVLLDGCVTGIQEGAKVLRGSFKSDEGRSPSASASALAQEALNILRHLEKIRYTEELYASHEDVQLLRPFCDRYVALEKLFHEGVAKELIRLANVAEKQSVLTQIWKWFTSAPEDTAQRGLRDAAKAGRLSDLAPQLGKLLDEIIHDAGVLSEEIERLPPFQARA